MSAVYLDSWFVRAGLGGRFLDRLVQEDHIISIWTCSEQQNVRARDVAYGRNHGTWENLDGWTRGVTVDLPDGMLGAESDGTAYILVPDDGDSGFVPPGYEVGRNMSFVGGSMLVVALVRTSTNDATRRCIAQKQATNSSGNGWHCAVLNGQARFFLRVSGSTIFDFGRGSIADGEVHLLVFQYRPSIGEATIWIDGVQSGAAVTGVTTEPNYVAADMMMGRFADGSGGFIGARACVALGRAPNEDVAAALQATREWSDITADILALEPLRCRYGIRGSGVLDNVASPGELTFALDNSDQNSAGLRGLYTPLHVNQLEGFGVGVPVQFGIEYGTETYFKFRGWVSGIRPTAGIYGEQVSYITCTDWFGVAARMFVSALETQIDQRSDQVLKALLDQLVNRTPPAVDINVGSSTFKFAGDIGGGDQESVLTEAVRITGSERGVLYQRGDTVQGGTFTYEGRGDRQVLTDLAATFDNNMHGIEVTFGMDHLYNIVRVVVTPRRVDDTPQVLARLEISQQAIEIAPGKIYVFEGGYRDPGQQAARVGGIDFEDPDPGVDYAFWSGAAGTGTDLTADLAIRFEYGGSSFRVEIENTGASAGFLYLDADTGFQIRGKGIYHFNPITVERRNAESVRKYGPRAVQIDLQYESSIDVAESVADYVLPIVSNERQMPTALALLGNYSDEYMTRALELEVGSKVGIVEDMTAVTTTDPDSDTEVGYFINEVALELSEGEVLRVQWTLAPAAFAAAGRFDESAFDEDFRFAY